MRIIKVILGVLLAVGGIYCMFTPIATYSTLAWLIGLAMIAEGVASVITWSSRRELGLANGWTLAAGAEDSVGPGGWTARKRRKDPVRE